MTGDNHIVPPENQGTAPQGDPDNLTPEAMMEIGDALSQSLQFALGRDYLDGPVFETGAMRLADGGQSAPPDAAFLELEQVGRPVGGGQETVEFFTAMQTTLAACHDPRFNLVFVVSSDGLRNRIYLGVTARTGGTQPQRFADQLGQFLCANWPGTRVRPVEDYQQVVRYVHQPLSTYRYARSFTGIPSFKRYAAPQERTAQSFDRFMRGLRGKPYVYLVIAEPMAENEVTAVITAANTLSGQVHAFTRATIQRSTGSSTSETSSQSESTSTSKSSSQSTNQGEAVGVSKGVLGSMLDKSSGMGKGFKALGLGGASAGLLALGGPFMLVSMMGMVGQLLPGSNRSLTRGTSTSQTDGSSASSSTSASSSAAASESLSFSREYLNKHAVTCERVLSQTVERFETARSAGSWNVGVYLVSDQREGADQGQSQLKALVSGQRTALEPIRAHDISPVWDQQAQIALDTFQQPALSLHAPSGGDPLQHPLGAPFEGMTTPMNTEELSLFVNLPLREMPGIPAQSTAYFSLNAPLPADPTRALALGELLEGGEATGMDYAVDLDTLTRHVFLTGITGSGKSNSCRRLITSLMERGVNFMVIEPAKNEYVQMALAYNQSGAYDRKIAVYMPGRSEWNGQPLDQFQINPFDIVRIPGALSQVMPHLDRLKSIFNASFPMAEVLPVILEEALVDLYDSQGWLADELPPAAVGRPTLEQLYNRILGLVRSKGYEERITTNITAALRTRIGSLLRGWKGDLFNHPLSTPWPDLFDRPVVVNLQGMGDDADKCFTMSLLLNFMYEYRQAQHEAAGSPETNALQHLAIIEEAHRILRAAPPGHSSEASSQVRMGEMFADILAEIRAYGQGLAIVDQVPAKLIPDALKNTNLKIVHRLVAADDRQAMAATMALTDEQTHIIARLKVGQAILCGVQDDTASWVQILPTPLPKHGQSK
jgi:hypothetical protein